MSQSRRAAFAISGIVLLTVATLASAKPSVECGATLTRSATLDADLVCGASGVTVAAPGVTLNCSGHTIRGTVPGGTGIQVAAENFTMVGCTIEGFSSGVKALDASGLKIARSRFSNLNTAVRVDMSNQVVLADNTFDLSLGNISMRDCPGSTVERNEFHPLDRHVGLIILERSPGARIRGNRSTQGLSIVVWRASDDSVVSNNSLGAIGQVSVGRSSRVTVTRNSAGALGSAHSGTLWGIELRGATECEVSRNDLAGAGIILLPFEESGPDGSPIIIGADGNRIRDNEIEGATFGLLFFGGSRNLVERNDWTRCEIAVAAFPYVLDEALPTTPSADNDVQRNVLDAGSYGVYTANAGGNRYEGNLIRGFAVGVTETATIPGVRADVFRNNEFEDNGYFGLLAVGASPLVSGNHFRRNGSADQPPGAGLFPHGVIIGSSRGAIGLFPFNGHDPDTIDDGDSSNDLLSEPLIGADEPNEFADNTFADIYSLDTRAANAPQLATANRFGSGGTVARVQQDWFAAVRVALPDSRPASDAIVELVDALGAPIAAMSTALSGVSPDGCDPTRPMGRLPGEVAGPTPQWFRITEFVVDGDGNRTDFTPHQITARSGSLTGQATYTWNGCRDAECAELRRYQLADVTLGP